MTRIFHDVSSEPFRLARGLRPDVARDVLREEARRAGLTEADHAALVIRRQTRDDG